MTTRAVGYRISNAEIYGSPPATDQDWASPEFDYLQPEIARLEHPDVRCVGGRQWAHEQAQRWREARPWLIGNIRRSLGDPKWDPRGATVTSIKRQP